MVVVAFAGKPVGCAGPMAHLIPVIESSLRLPHTIAPFLFTQVGHTHKEVDKN